MIRISWEQLTASYLDGAPDPGHMFVTLGTAGLVGGLAAFLLCYPAMRWLARR